jgi:hypothetical protein
VADHAGAAANVAFGDGTAADRVVERGKGVLLGQRVSLDIAQPAIVCLGDDRQVKGLGSAVANRNGRDGIADDSDLIGVGDADRRAEQALLGEPRKAGHLAVAVE